MKIMERRLAQSSRICKAMRSFSVLCSAVILCISFVQSEERAERIVRTAQGPVRGYKEGDVYAFYGIPYATSPTGKYRYTAPLAPPTWLSIFEATRKNIVCPQIPDSRYIGSNKIIQEDCLVANVFIPDTSVTNLPVIIYVHGGGFRIGYGEYFTAKNWLKMKKFILVTFNYRLGAHGFLCLGSKDIPGNAGMKDQVALLRWVKKNIASFGGNPDDVTIAGHSAGAASVDLLMLSPSAKGLFNKVIPESSANVGAFSVQIDPIENAKKYARLLNFTDVDDLNILEEFYKTTSFEVLFTDVFADIKSSLSDYDTFSPCVERKSTEDTFLDSSPYSILESGNYEKVPILYGFTNMEGLLYIPFYENWKSLMNKKFSNFLPPNLKFQDNDAKEKIANKFKEYYFGDKIDDDKVLQYIDYFSHLNFVYPTIQAIELHIKAGHEKLYVYEYSYVDELDPTNSSLVPYEEIYGATHCAQTMALFDGHGVIRPNEDEFSKEYLEVKSLMRELWTNFITKGSPVPEGSSLPSWPAAGAGAVPYMSLNRKMELRNIPIYKEHMRFWGDVYDRYYRPPAPPAVLHENHNIEL